MESLSLRDRSMEPLRLFAPSANGTHTEIPESAPMTPFDPHETLPPPAEVQETPDTVPSSIFDLRSNEPLPVPGVTEAPMDVPLGPPAGEPPTVPTAPIGDLSTPRISFAPETKKEARSDPDGEPLRFNATGGDFIGVDAGTTFFAFALNGRILMHEGKVVTIPSFAAYFKDSGTLAYIGQKAKELYMRQGNDSKYKVVRVMDCGRPADQEVYKDFVHRAMKENFDFDMTGWTRKMMKLSAFTVITAYPPESVKAVQDNYVDFNRRTFGNCHLHLTDQAMTAAIGLGVDFESTNGRLVADFGGATLDITGLKSDGAVCRIAVPIGGDMLNRTFIHFMRKKYQLRIDYLEAERAKLEIGVAQNPSKIKDLENKTYTICGMRNHNTAEEEISYDTYWKAVKMNIELLEGQIEEAISTMPEGLSRDLKHTGLFLAGGSSQLRGLDERLEEALNIPVNYDPIRSPSAGIRGLAVLTKNKKMLYRITGKSR